jgi:hypothetical protein
MGTRGFLFAFATFAFHALCIVASRAEESCGAAPNNIKEHLDSSRAILSGPDRRLRRRISNPKERGEISDLGRPH